MPGSTSRLGISFPVGTDNVSVYPAVAQAAATALDNAVTFSSGTLTNRPLSSLAGRVYYATDVGLWFLDTGFGWVWNSTGIGGPPIGAVQPYVGSTDPVDPDGVIRWVVMDGRTLSRTTYSVLFGMCGTTYGAGNGSTTFNIPNPKSRSVIGAGQGAGLSNRSLGTTGGEETVTLTSVTQIPSHTHGVSGGTSNEGVNHSHAYNALWDFNPGGFSLFQSGGTGQASSTGVANMYFGATSTGLESSPHAHTVSGATDPGTGLGGGSHDNMHPYLALNYIVRVL